MTDVDKQIEFEKALGLLPWYAKGTLLPEENQWVSSQLEKNPELADELALIKKQISFTEGYIDNLETDTYEDNPERLLALKNRIKNSSKQYASQSSTQIDSNNKSDKKSLWTKLLSYLPHSQGGWQTAGAFAMGIMLIQGIVIFQLYNTKQETEYTTLGGEPEQISDETLVFITRFDLNASIYDVDALLTKYSLNIVNGPDAGGLYQLSYIGKSINEKAIDKMISELEEQDNVIRFIAREN